MVWVIVGLVAVSAALFVLAASQFLVQPEARLVRRRLEAVPMGEMGIREIRERRRRRLQRESLEGFLEAFGARVAADSSRRKSLRAMLVHAGYRSPRAGLIFMALRVLLAGAFFLVGVVAAASLGMTPQNRLLLIVFGGLLGWMLPFILVRRKARIRQDEIQRTLPDALDMMVVCVEAGMGLNQALVRVGEEMDRISRSLAEEFALVSLEIRAGTPREEALRHLGDRTGVADMRAFVSMLIQTDRFGTSIGQALRIHADETRTKRRQRAEEAAAKLAVKLLIPIVLFVFPSIFIVILGPASFRIAQMFGTMGGGP